jgi:hypothetical protein
MCFFNSFKSVIRSVSHSPFCITSRFISSSPPSWLLSSSFPFFPSPFLPPPLLEKSANSKRAFPFISPSHCSRGSRQFAKQSRKSWRGDKVAEKGGGKSVGGRDGRGGRGWRRKIYMSKERRFDRQKETEVRPLRRFHVSGICV